MGIKKTRGRKRKSIQKRRSRKQQKKRGTLRKKNRSRKRAGGWPWSRGKNTHLNEETMEEQAEAARRYGALRTKQAAKNMKVEGRPPGWAAVAAIENERAEAAEERAKQLADRTNWSAPS